MKLWRISKSESGSVAVIFAVALVPILGLSGAAVDYVRATQSRSKIQAAADNAALSAVLAQVPTTTQREQVAQQVFGSTKPSGMTVSPTFSVTSTSATVAASGQVETSLLKVIRIPSIAVASRAVAIKVFEGPPPCVLALNRTADKALLITGAAQYVALGCVLHSNSSSALALTIDNNAVVQAGGYCAVGKSVTPSTLTPTPRSYCEPLLDPFRNVPVPSVGSCIANGLVVDPKVTKALNPGTYCNGLTIKGTANLAAGVYVISGPLTIESQATITGSGVTFYLTGTGAGFTIAAGAAITLTAPTSGPYGGILFFVDRAANPSFVNTFAGGSTTKVMGSIYAPSQKVRVGGGSGLSQDIPFMPIIADQVEITGNIKASADLPGGTLASPLPKSESGVRLVE
jgi:Flp pilus assembly protein TadG